MKSTVKFPQPPFKFDTRRLRIAPRTDTVTHIWVHIKFRQHDKWEDLNGKWLEMVGTLTEGMKIIPFWAKSPPYITKADVEKVDTYLDQIRKDTGRRIYRISVPGPGAKRQKGKNLLVIHPACAGVPLQVIHDATEVECCVVTSSKTGDLVMIEIPPLDLTAAPVNKLMTARWEREKAKARAEVKKKRRGGESKEKTTGKHLSPSQEDMVRRVTKEVILRLSKEGNLLL